MKRSRVKFDGDTSFGPDIAEFLEKSPCVKDVAIELRRPVQIMGRDGETVLVQWTGVEGLMRCYIPAVEIHAGNMVSDDVLEKGVEYGVDWAELAEREFKFTPVRLRHELRRAGVWSAADVISNPKTVFAAVQRAIGIDVSVIVRMAQKLENGGQK